MGGDSFRKRDELSMKSRKDAATFATLIWLRIKLLPVPDSTLPARIDLPRSHNELAPYP